MSGEKEAVLVLAGIILIAGIWMSVTADRQHPAAVDYQGPCTQALPQNC